MATANSFPQTVSVSDPSVTFSGDYRFFVLNDGVEFAQVLGVVGAPGSVSLIFHGASLLSYGLSLT
jgi:hypothetical protein